MPTPPFDQLAFARSVLVAEADAVRAVADRLGESFAAVVDVLAGCRGRLAVCGVGKSADIGQKIVGTLNSTGTRSYLLDATRAVHGDLGMLHPDDVAVLLSHSGESEELVRLLGPLKGMAAAVVAVCGNAGSSVAKAADAALVYGPITEACPLSLAPSSSTTVMLALGDALAFTLSERRQFTAEQFAQFHPAGSLGRQLAPVERVMRKGAELRLAAATDSVRTVFAKARHHGRRTGAVMLVAADGTLAGLFTDSDLARLFESRVDVVFDRPVSEVMTANPITVNVSARMSDVMELLRTRKISELPVVDDAGRPVGVLDITDLIGMGGLEEKTSPPGPLSIHGEGVFKAETILRSRDREEAGNRELPARGRGSQEVVSVLNTPSPFDRMPGLPGRPGVPAERGTGGEVFPSRPTAGESP